MRKLVVLIQAMTPVQDQRFAEHLTATGWSYWHWVDGAWLITTNNLVLDPATSIRNKLMEIAPGKYSLIFESRGVSPQYAGFGPQTDQNHMFNWVNANWLDPI